MPSIPVKQCTVTQGHEPRFYADVGDTVSVRGPDGKGLVAAKVESIDGDRVKVRHLHDDEVLELSAAEVVGVFRT